MARFRHHALCRRLLQLQLLLLAGTASAAEHAVGIDLGTTNTVIARYYMVGAGTQGEVFIDDQGERLTPSVVHFERDDGELLVGHAAKNMLVKDPASTVYGVKRLLGKEFDAVASLTRDLAFEAECSNSSQTLWDTVWQYASGESLRSVGPCPDKDFKNQLARVAHRSHQRDDGASFGGVCVWQWEAWWPVELISALVLKEAKQSAERVIGAPVRSAVVTIPAYFGEPQKKATRMAAQIAGFDVLRLLAEPTAAAISYARNKKEDFAAAEQVLVFDLGGGTFDVSILAYLGAGEFKVLAVTGDAFLGGEDLDVAVAKWLLAEFEREHGEFVRGLPAEKRTRLFPRFLRAGRQAKEKLSFQTSFRIVIDAVGPGGDDFAVKLTRAKFERMCSAFFDRLMPVVRQGIRDAGLRKGDIDRVLLVGGSSRIPKVRELLKSEFGREATQVLNPDEAVADGAAVLAFQLANPGTLAAKDGSIFGILYDTIFASMGAETASQHSHEITVRDVAAHSLGVTYWAGDCSAGQIKGDGQLAERLVREGAKSGDVRVSLMWNDFSDLDLHVTAPSSQKIYFGNKRSGCGGELDVDMNYMGAWASREPVENVFWQRAPRGTYIVVVHMYHNRNEGGAASSFSGEVEVGGVVTPFQGSVRARSDKIEVARFEFDGVAPQHTARRACERKMKIIVPKNTPLPFFAAPQDFVVSSSPCMAPFMRLPIPFMRLHPFKPPFIYTTTMHGGLSALCSCDVVSARFSWAEGQEVAQQRKRRGVSVTMLAGGATLNRAQQVPAKQRRVIVDILEGENVEDVAANTLLGTFELTRVADSEAQAGSGAEAQVHVKLGLDADGVIEASVRDKQSGKTTAITLNRHG